MQACWAFGTTGSIEGAHYLATKQLVSLSEQQLVDCSTAGNKGCKGGDAIFSYKYILANKGLATEDDYPYDIMGYDKKPPPVHACNTSLQSHHNVTSQAIKKSTIALSFLR